VGSLAAYRARKKGGVGRSVGPHSGRLFHQSLPPRALAPTRKKKKKTRRVRLVRLIHLPPPSPPFLLVFSSQSSAAVFATPVVRTAWAIATAAHVGQAARSGVPMAAHCVEVARGVAGLGADADTVAAALLHGALSRGLLASPDALAAALPAGPSRAAVTSLVRSVARMSDLCAVRRWSTAAAAAAAAGGEDTATDTAADDDDGNDSPLDAGALVDVLLAMADPRAAVIKLVDRVVALRAAVAAGGDAAGAAAADALALYAPLANRLGVWCLKAELEDLAFAARHPAQHAELAARLGRGGGPSTGTAPARASLDATLDAMRAALAAAGLGDTADLTGRPKHLYGVFTKMRAKGVPLEAVTDVRAVRVIVPDKAACYHALRAVQGRWKAGGGGECAAGDDAVKDYIRHPKPNGYQSLHVVVTGDDGAPVEVQIRTPKMHLVAEFGLAAHWRYKERGGGGGGGGDGGDAPSALSPSEARAARVGYARWLLAWAYELDDKQCRRDAPGAGGLVSRLAAAVQCVDGEGGGAGEPHAHAHAHTSACGPFPGEHAPDCRFAAFLRRQSALPAGPLLPGSGLAPPPPPGSGDAVSIVVVDHTGASPAGSPTAADAIAFPASTRYAPRVETVPAGTTAGALAARLTRDAARDAGVPLSAVHVLINDAHVPPGSTAVIEVGDKVDVFADEVRERACRGGGAGDADADADAPILISGAPVRRGGSGTSPLDLDVERERLARIFRRPSGAGGSPPDGAAGASARRGEEEGW